ncbi:hypothetical protein ACFFKU_10320 [Kineococcus gynurae]|uniref:Uncharacterized protein n=1 Tax=Kineococcus gynurae TaxID=452979 RepID=A0ABV5LV06_9ACTN
MVGRLQPGGHLSHACDVCARPVGDGEGELRVDERDVLDYPAAVRRFDDQVDRVAAGADPEDWEDWEELWALPRPARWVVRHHGCAGSGTAAFSIPVEEVRSVVALLRWTLVLHTRVWLPVTDWDDWVRRTCAAHGVPLTDDDV